MGKKAKTSDKKKLIQKIYREYARIKYKKYKLQFPRLREPELVNKILAEWEALNEEDKLQIGEEYAQRSGKQFLIISSSSSREKQKQKKQQRQRINRAKKFSPNIDLSNTKQKISSSAKVFSKKKPKVPSPKVRVWEGPSISTPQSLGKNIKVDPDSDFKKSEEQRQQGKKSTPGKSSSQSQIQATSMRRVSQIGKNIAKQRRLTERTQFLKYYYEKLAAEHPRWSKIQIQTIVRLLWRKKTINRKSQQKVPSKGLSGRQMYRRSKQSQGFLRDQIKNMWKSLPHESKIYWTMKGGKKKRIHKSERASIKQIRKVLNTGAENDNQDSTTSFRWMEQIIR